MAQKISFSSFNFIGTILDINYYADLLDFKIEEYLATWLSASIPISYYSTLILTPAKMVLPALLFIVLRNRSKTKKGGLIVIIVHLSPSDTIHLVH